MPQKKFDAVGIGLNSADQFCVVREYPKQNTKSGILEIAREGGGQAATAMAALARLGLNVAYIGVVGDDEAGAFSLSSLEAEGVNVDGVVMQRGRASQFALIIVQQEGEEEEKGARTILWRREVSLAPEDVGEEIVRAGRALHLDGHYIEAEIAAARWAREEGAPVFLDAERAPEGIEDLIGLTDYLVAAEDFPALLTGVSDHREALRRLHAMGPEVVGVTLGARGALAYDGARFYESPGFHVDVLDTTGAGDAFHGGFLYGVLRKMGLEDTLRFANAVAAMNCTALGGRTALPRLSEVEAFLRANSPRESP
ncbi:MAG: PfkB family carbohydrate kinase [Nitrospinae bacterium]|nr:PfkB family carbohydrate kinase [Nitrospinota bacterium]